jgi:hypothetical protein
LGNVGTADEVDVLTRAPDGAEPLVRKHAARALPRGTPAVGSAEARGRPVRPSAASA